ncbi:MAG TPA: alcohol dehydrogenase catalytic domain-containing protein [Candidatus Omnitrophota bacterium]|nr:alcohol dehydrogenase catalytic domain-containing protein [Candidatus Omnitrophota bacterium]
MKVAVYYRNSDIRIQEIPRPEIREGEILVRVRASGICGTDVMEWYRIKKAPRILGHEIAGDIAESRSPGFKPGQRVFVSHHVPCNQCEFCLEGNHTACETLHGGNYDPGGYSEFVRVPAINVERGTYLLPDEVSYEEGTMIEPLACVVRGQRLIGVKKGQTVLILGSGVSGLLNIRMAKKLGAGVIATDVDEYRLKKAKACGADEAIHASSPLDFGANHVILCTGALSAVGQAFRCVKRKGTILLFAIPDRNIEIPTADVWRNEITVTSSYGAAPADLEEALNLIRDGSIPVKDLITHTLPLEDIQKGFNLVAGAKESLKVVLIPS